MKRKEKTYAKVKGKTAIRLARGGLQLGKIG